MSERVKIILAVVGSAIVYIPFTIFFIPSKITTSSMAGTYQPGQWIFANTRYSLIQRNDIIVYDYPADEGKTLYAHRCVGLPGDRLAVKNRQLYINEGKVKNPEKLQYSYAVKSTMALRGNFFKKYHIIGQEVYRLPDGRYTMHLSPQQVKELQSLDFIKQVAIPDDQAAGRNDCFPQSPLFSWTPDNFGPVTIPRKGWKIELTEENMALYGRCIQVYEDQENLLFDNNVIMQDDKPLSTYTFTKDYYFVMGDNRNNSLDSRYWGFLPENYIQRKVW